MRKDRRLSGGHHLRRGAMLVFGLMAALAVLELVLLVSSRGADHLPGFFAPNPDGSFALAAATRTEYWHSGRVVTVTIGPDGKRLVPSAPPKAPTTLHILGDSQVFGWGLDDAESLPERLQVRLGADVRVVNHGAPGLGPLGYLRTLGTLPAKDPAIVVLTEMNDFQDSYSAVPTVTHHCGFIVRPGGIGQQVPCWLLRSQIASLLMDLRNRVTAERTPLPLGFNPYAVISARVLCKRVENNLLGYLERRTGATALVTIPWEAELLPTRLPAYAPRLKEARAHTRLPGGTGLHQVFAAAPQGAELFQENDHHVSAQGAQQIAEYLAALRDWQAPGRTRAGPSLEGCQFSPSAP